MLLVKKQITEEELEKTVEELMNEAYRSYVRDFSIFTVCFFSVAVNAVLAVYHYLHASPNYIFFAAMTVVFFFAMLAIVQRLSTTLRAYLTQIITAYMSFAIHACGHDFSKFVKEFIKYLNNAEDKVFKVVEVGDNFLVLSLTRDIRVRVVWMKPEEIKEKIREAPEEIREKIREVFETADEVYGGLFGYISGAVVLKWREVERIRDFLKNFVAALSTTSNVHKP